MDWWEQDPVVSESDSLTSPTEQSKAEFPSLATVEAGVPPAPDTSDWWKTDPVAPPAPPGILHRIARKLDIPTSLKEIPSIDDIKHDLDTLGLTQVTSFPLPHAFGQQEGIVRQVVAGVANLPADIWNFATSPAGVAVGGVSTLGPLIQRAVAAGFTADQIRQGLHAGSLQDQVELAVGAALGAYGSLRGEPTQIRGQRPEISGQWQPPATDEIVAPAATGLRPAPERAEPVTSGVPFEPPATDEIITPAPVTPQTEPASTVQPFNPSTSPALPAVTATPPVVPLTEAEGSTPSPAGAGVLYHEDPTIPFMSKVRTDDMLKTQGLTDDEISTLTTAQVQQLILKSTPPVQPPRNLETAGPPAVPSGQPLARDEGVPAPTPEEIAAETQHQTELLAQAQVQGAEHGAEFLDAVQRAGGFPARQSPHRSTWRGEIEKIEEEARNPSRAEKISLNKLFRQSAPSLDELATRLRDQGFPTQTPDDLYNMALQRLRTGKPLYGIPETARLFASGSAAPRLRSGEKGTGDLFQGDEQPFNLAGETGIDYAARQAKAETEAKAKQTADEAAAAAQGKLFTAGTAAPHRPPKPLPLPAPVPTPVVRAAVPPVRSWWQQRTLGVRKLLAPQTIDIQARRVANIVRDYNGQEANTIIRADHALAAARKDFDRTPVPRSWKYDPAQPLPRNYAFMAESERGGANLSPQDRQLKKQLDSMFSEAVDEVHRVKPAALQSLIQDYFPHIWEDPAAATRAFASIVGHRPLEGSKAFLKQRSLAYVEDGLKMGLRPVSDNPVDIALTKLHEVHKFVAAQDMLAEAKAIGARKFVYIFEKPPDDWVKVDDPTSTVHGPPFVTVAEAFDEQMRVKTVELLDNLGIPHERVAKLGGKRWGTFKEGGGGIRTKFAGPMSVYWHELGHGLQERYGWIDEITRGARLSSKDDPIAIQLRALADLRVGGQQTTPSFQKYIRSKDEKAAVMLEAYMHAPEKMRDVAPDIYARVKKFIADRPELHPIEEIRPSLVLGTSKQQIDVGGMVTLGNYYMPEGAATVINNYLSPGLMRFGVIRAIRQSTHILSGAQLGFSAFHAGFTSIDAAVSQFAAGLRYASEGKFGKAASRIAVTPLAPAMNYYTGKAVQTAMIDPNWGGKVKVFGKEVQLSPHGTATTNQIALLAEKAGLRATVDPFWKTQITRNMMRAWHEGGVKGYAGTVLRLPFAASEQMMRPILEYLVPRQKLGVFAGMAQAHMERLGPDADVHAVRDAMARAADATEDRMGQMTYDNLFYNRAVRDVALLGFRAYGWTYGKYRALFGGLSDIAGVAGRVREGGPVVTDRMAYLLALPMVAAGIGSVINYALTGEAPQDWKDALMPRTGKLDRQGNPQRLSLPAYIKDILSDWHDFPNTKKMLVSFGHKLNPWISVAADIINNADFYHTKVYDEDDPILKQQADKVQFVLKSAEPFSVTGAQRLTDTPDAGLMDLFLPFFGFVPAKAELSMSPAQIRSAELMRDRYPQGARSQDQAAHSKLISELMQDMKANSPDAQAKLGTALAGGQIQPRDVMRVAGAPTLSPMQYQVKKLTADDAMKVWDLANPQERDQLRTIILMKVIGSKTLKPEDTSRYINVLTQPNNGEKRVKPDSKTRLRDVIERRRQEAQAQP